jgi:hypothetical protein
MNVCAAFHEFCRSLPRHHFPYDESLIPKNGIYILFEKGEEGHSGERIVRIGTHTGADQLRSRLYQHFVQENKDRSIFRKNIGRCLLANDLYLPVWEIDYTTQEAKKSKGSLRVAKKEQDIEKQITNHLQQRFSFVVFQIDDKNARLELESKMISTVAQCEECAASATWLGKCSPKEKISSGKLWLVNEINKQTLSEEDIKILRKKR